MCIRPRQMREETYTAGWNIQLLPDRKVFAKYLFKTNFSDSRTDLLLCPASNHVQDRRSKSAQVRNSRTSSYGLSAGLVLLIPLHTAMVHIFHPPEKNIGGVKTGGYTRADGSLRGTDITDSILHSFILGIKTQTRSRVSHYANYSNHQLRRHSPKCSCRFTNFCETLVIALSSLAANAGCPINRCYLHKF
jgi:hypothetical protein